MKALKDLLYKVSITGVNGSTNLPISNVTADSRKVSPGSLFVALRGTLSDGHDFISEVAEKGCAAVVCEEIPKQIDDGITYVKVRNSSEALGFIAANLYDNPSASLKVVGITGTNGKTTTATLLFRLFRELGFSVGLLSTVKNQVNEEVIPSTHTTPDALKLQALLRHMADEGCTHCFMEVSSHAVVQHRVTGLEFSGGVFTNLTHDHLDYHKTFDAYLNAKKGFFDMLPSGAFALVNKDDKNGKVMVQNTKARIKTFSVRSQADFRLKVLENNFTGLLLQAGKHELALKLIGSFNASNIAAVYGSALMLGQDPDLVLPALSNLDPVDGRFDCFISPSGITGIVDYAHTPDALRNVLSTIKDIRTGNEKVITIIGCGGNRDTAKRPVMAAIACEGSDKVILTSDNPRGEDPLEILRQMQGGVPPQHFKKSLTIADRKEAIRTACSLANRGDIILLAGKGHEKYQEINGVKHPFDDKAILLETFKQMQG